MRLVNRESFSKLPKNGWLANYPVSQRRWFGTYAFTGPWFPVSDVADRFARRVNMEWWQVPPTFRRCQQIALLVGDTHSGRCFDVRSWAMNAKHNYRWLLLRANVRLNKPENPHESSRTQRLYNAWNVAARFLGRALGVLHVLGCHAS